MTYATTINAAYASYIEKTYAQIAKINPETKCTIYVYSDKAAVRQKYHFMPQNARRGQEWFDVSAADLKSTIEGLKSNGIRIAEVYVPGIGYKYCF